MLWLSVANKDVYIIYCLLFTYSAFSVTYLPPRGVTVHALNRKSVKKMRSFPSRCIECPWCYHNNKVTRYTFYRLDTVLRSLTLSQLNIDILSFVPAFLCIRFDAYEPLLLYRVQVLLIAKVTQVYLITKCTEHRLEQ